jgi:sterol desaturase/sphingolipid hydroxylase (fatty acid hydroxylase superfamily)
MTQGLAVLIFPFLWMVPIWLGIVGLRAGWNHQLLIVATVGGALLCQVGLEWALPYRREWRDRRRVGPDLAYLGLATLTGIALDLGALALVYAGAAWLAGAWGGALWPTGWHLAAQLGLAVLVADLGHYGAHRALHDVPWLWRFHRLHHVPDHLYALNFFRMHPVEIALKTLANVTPLILLGAPREVIALWSIVSGVAAGSVNHANIATRTDVFDRILSTPATHRFHHSIAPEERGNLGNVTLLYDWIFGTYVPPRGRDIEAVGT